MRSKKTAALVAASLTGAILLAACGSDDNGGSSSDTTPAASGDAMSLKDVCPDTIVIQTDWNPEAEHGALYQMVGANPTVDTDKKVVTAALVTSGGKDTGVKIEVRAGGPATGYQLPDTQMYQDPSILLGYVGTDSAVQNYNTLPSVAIVAPLEVNPQIIMWDPATYADAKTIADLKPDKVTIRVFPGGAYMQFLISSGQVDKSQVDESYDGSPAVFVAQGGKDAQQGFASAEPYIYKNEVKEWGKDVAFQLIHDAGWTAYAAPLAVRKADLEKNKDCFKKLVPIVQQAQVDYIKDPAAANALILDLIAKYNTGWVYSKGVADFSVEQQLKLDLVGNGSDTTLGNFDDARLTDFIAKALPVYKENNPPADLKPSDITTNEFIDPSIGLSK